MNLRHITSACAVAVIALASDPAHAAALLTGITPVLSAGAATSLVARSSSATAYSVIATSQSTTAGMLIGYNAVAVPADGALTPSLVIDCVALPANGTAAISDEPSPGTNYTVGVVYLISTGTSCYIKTTGAATAFIKAKVQ